MKTFALKILQPDKKIYDGEAVSITVNCENGQLSVLAGHEPMAAKLVEGPFILRTEKETLEGTAGHGLLFVDRNETAVMVYSFAFADDNEAEELISETPEQTARELL